MDSDRKKPKPKMKKDRAARIKAIDDAFNQQFLNTRQQGLLSVMQGDDVPPVNKAARWDHGLNRN